MSQNLDPSQGQKVEVDLEAYVAVLSSQRNQALDSVAQQAGMISRMQKQIDDLTRQLMEAKEPPATPSSKPHLVDPPAA